MKHIHTFLGILLVFALNFPVFSQKDTEFWFVAPEIAQAANNLDRPVAFRFSTYGSPAVVSISQPANAAFPVQTISLAANSSGNLEFPPLFNLVENTPPNTVLNKGFFIKSTAPITAYYEIIGTVPNNPELFSLKGKNALGTTFYVPFQNVTENSSAYTPTPYAAFDIVATQNNTTVTISPTQPIVGSPSATPLTVVLNKGQTYSARALSQAASAHPTGSKVVADKPIAITVKDDLLEGNTLFGGFCRDVMGDQIVPVEKVGTRYVVQKGFLDGDERAFVVATVPNTQVSLDGVSQGTINAGQTLELVITAGSHFVESTAPVYVLQMTGLNCEVAGEILPTLDCSGSKEVRFVRSTNQEFHMFLVTRNGIQDGFALNGNAGLIPASAFSPVPGSNGDFVAAVITFSTIAVAPGQSSVVNNTQGEFQMGFLDGGLTTGCRYGFFSDFGNQVKIENDITFCPGASVNVNGVSYNQPGTVMDTIPGVSGCDTVRIYNLQYAPTDLVFDVKNVSCQNGAISVQYDLCNLGSGPLPAEVRVLFCTQNPTTEVVTTQAILKFDTGGADSCISGTQIISGLPVDDNSTLYTVVNFNGSIPTPFSFNDFPVTDIEECNYFNNLDSIFVNLPNAPLLNLGPDAVLCGNSTVVLNAGGGFVKYFWQDGSTAASFTASDPGIYWVIATDSCGSTQIDSVLLIENLLSDTIELCPGESVTIGGVTYNQPGTVVDTIPGLSGCDTIITYQLQYAPGDLAVNIEEVFCQDGALKVRYSMCKLGSGPWPAKVSLLFSPQNPTAEFMSFVLAYQINTSGADSCFTGIQTITDLPISDNDPLFVLINVDTISGIVSLDDFPAASDECNYYNNFDSIIVSLPDAPVLDLGPDVVLCSDSTVVFNAGSGFVNYFWQDGSNEATFAATDPGIYWVVVTDSCGSIQFDSILLSVSLLPDTQFPDSAICPGSAIALSLPGFDNYEWTPAAGLSCSDCADVVISPATTTQYSLLATTVEGCELRDTFVITIKPVEQLADTIEFCPGEFVTIGGVNYDQSGIVADTTTGSNGCDKITTYTLIRLPQPVVFSTVEFCKGDTVLIAGNVYTQPGIVMDTIPAPGGCPTIATYTLVYLDDPDAVLSIDCIDDINIATQAGTGPVAIDYDLPVAASDCVCPGVSLALTEGLPSGSLFPITTTKVCYEASDSCGNTAKCCFNVTVREEQPCDVKEIGCMKYELLDIRRNINTLNLSYRIRVTNKCDNRMIYTAIEIPDGTVAVAPANNSVYSSEDGRQYDVRNPNYSPFYSIRFKSTNDSIFGGNSDIFQYTLPPQTDVDYIHVTSRLYPQIFFEAYLNTFNCPIELVDDTPRPGDERSTSAPAAGLRVFPNPTSGTLYADLSGWQGQQLRISLTDALGKLLQQQYITANAAPQQILLPEGLADGLYFFEATAENGEKSVVRIVLKQ